MAERGSTNLSESLCTIPGIVEAIRGIRRVLKPHGELVFFELGRSPDPAVRHWQKRLEPVYRWLFQGLCLTQDIPALIVQGGFQIEQMEMAYLTRFPKSSSYCWWARPFRKCEGEVGHSVPSGTARSRPLRCRAA